MSQYYVPCGSDQVAFRSDGNAATLACWSRGLYNYTNAPEISASLDDDPTKVWSPAELLAIAFAHPPNFPPGTAYEYCNTNYALLGLMAEKIDGKPLASCFHDRLFGPLGLKETMLPASTSNTLPDPYSHGYLYGGSSFALVDKPYPPGLQAAARAGTLKPDDCTGQNPSYASAAGAPSPPPTISPPGSRHWSAARCSTRTISAGGLTACSPKTRASPTGSSTGTASVVSHSRCVPLSCAVLQKEILRL